VLGVPCPLIDMPRHIAKYTSLQVTIEQLNAHVGVCYYPIYLINSLLIAL
jgi:hypothetical protein